MVRTKADTWILLFDDLTVFLGKEHVGTQRLFRGVWILLLRRLFLLEVGGRS